MSPWPNPDEKGGCHGAKEHLECVSWDNPAWGEVAAGSFNGAECAGECQQKRFLPGLWKEKMIKGTWNYWLQLWVYTNKFSGLGVYSALVHLYLIFESLVKVYKLNAYQMHEHPDISTMSCLVGPLSANPAPSNRSQVTGFWPHRRNREKTKGRWKLREHLIMQISSWENTHIAIHGSMPLLWLGRFASATSRNLPAWAELPRY